MNRLMFEDPVTIVVGLGLPTQIENVMEAYTFLAEWPPSKQDTAHSVALKVCKAALAGEVDPETARATFVAFARRNDLLAPTTDEVIAARSTGAFGEGVSF